MHAQLSVTGGLEGGRSLQLAPGQRLIVGRAFDAGLRLEDEGVSRNHAALALISCRVYVTDLSSQHGTILAGEPLRPGIPRLVLPGTRVQVGPYVIDIELQGLDPRETAWSDHERQRVRSIIPDQYEVLGKVGGGALGRVWAARELATGRTVAVKVLRAELEENSEAYARFLREMELLKGISSPYVVEFIDAGTMEGRPYIVTELVHGPSVCDRLEEEDHLPIPEALRIGADVARALMAIEAAHIVHRDIKPQNILLCPGGPAKLTDFGIAKSLVEDSEEDDITGLGKGLGTLSYLAPEQGEDAKSVDARTDLYGLGATLYHLIAGHPPLLHQESDTSLNVLEALQNQEPAPLSEERLDCPRSVTEVVEKLLARDPSDRLQPAEVVAKELDRLRETLYSVESPAETSKKGFRRPPPPQ